MKYVQAKTFILTLSQPNGPQMEAKEIIDQFPRAYLYAIGKGPIVSKATKNSRWPILIAGNLNMYFMDAFRNW